MHLHIMVLEIDGSLLESQVFEFSDQDMLHFLSCSFDHDGTRFLDVSVPALFADCGGSRLPRCQPFFLEEGCLPRC